MPIEGKKEHKNELATKPELQLVSLCMGKQDLSCAPGEGLGVQPIL